MFGGKITIGGNGMYGMPIGGGSIPGTGGTSAGGGSCGTSPGRFTGPDGALSTGWLLVRTRGWAGAAGGGVSTATGSATGSASCGTGGR